MKAGATGSSSSKPRASNWRATATRSISGRCSARLAARSGPGISDIYTALGGEDTCDTDPFDDRNIWTRGTDGHEKLAQAAVERFCMVLGSVAGDLALAHGAGGVVIAGGVGRRLRDFLPSAVSAPWPMAGERMPSRTYLSQLIKGLRRLAFAAPPSVQVRSRVGSMQPRLARSRPRAAWVPAHSVTVHPLLRPDRWPQASCRRQQDRTRLQSVDKRWLRPRARRRWAPTAPQRSLAQPPWARERRRRRPTSLPLVAPAATCGSAILQPQPPRSRGAASASPQWTRMAY